MNTEKNCNERLHQILQKSGAPKLQVMIVTESSQ